MILYPNLDIFKKLLVFVNIIFITLASAKDPQNIYVVYGNTEGAGVSQTSLLSIPDGYGVPARNQDVARKLQMIQEKGYRLIIVNTIENSELASIVSDPNTAGIFHHGHGNFNIYTDGTVENSISTFEKGETSGIKPANFYAHITDDFKPGKNLMFYYFTGCEGGLCETNLRNTFNFGDGIKYYAPAGNKTTTTDSIVKSITQGEQFKEVIKILPDNTIQLDKIILTAKKDATVLNDLLPWYQDSNKINQEKIRDLFKIQFQSDLVSTNSLLKNGSPNDIQALLKIMFDSKLSKFSALDFKTIQELLGHENYFVRHYATDFLLKNNYTIPPKHQSKIAQNLFTKKPSHIPYGYQYNKFQLNELSLSLLEHQTSFSANTYKILINNLDQNNTKDLTDLLRRFPEDTSKIKKVFLEQLKVTPFPESKLYLLESYKDILGIDDEFKLVLSELISSPSKVVMTNALYLLDDGTLIDQKSLDVLIKDYSGIQSDATKSQLVFIITKNGGDTNQIRNFLKDNYSKYEMDKKVKTDFLKAMGKIRTKDPKLIEILLSEFSKTTGYNAAAESQAFESLKQIEITDSKHFKILNKIFKTNNDKYAGNGQSKANKAKELVQLHHNKMSKVGKIKCILKTLVSR